MCIKMLRGINSSTVIFILMVMVVSCSASRSITTNLKNKVVSYQGTNKNLAKKLDSVPPSQLKPKEKEIKQEITKTVSATPARSLQGYDKVLEALDKQNKILVDVFNLNVATRMKNDSLEWMNRQKDTALLHRDRYIENLIAQREEDEQIGKAIKEQIESFGNIGLKIVIALFGVLGIILLGLNLLKRKLLKQVAQVKQENA
jgi:hypothetical protein